MWNSTQDYQFKLVQGPIKIMNMKISDFVFIFAYNIYSLTQSLSMFFYHSFLKISPKMLFMGYYSAKYTSYFL